MKLLKEVAGGCEDPALEKLIDYLAYYIEMVKSDTEKFTLGSLRSVAESYNMIRTLGRIPKTES